MAQALTAAEKKAIYVRVSPAVYDAIEAAAAQARRSMSAEAELRLEASIQNESAA